MDYYRAIVSLMEELTEDGGYPVLEHLRLILGGPVVWAPAVDGAIVLSARRASASGFSPPRRPSLSAITARH